MTQHGVPIGAKEPKGDFKDWVIPLFECPNHLRLVNFSITLYSLIYIYMYIVIVHI